MIICPLELTNDTIHDHHSVMCIVSMDDMGVLDLECTNCCISGFGAAGENFFSDSTIIIN